MVIKQRTGWGYETLVREVSFSLHLRRFCLIALSERVPHESTVRASNSGRTHSIESRRRSSRSSEMALAAASCRGRRSTARRPSSSTPSIAANPKQTTHSRTAMLTNTELELLSPRLRAEPELAAYLAESFSSFIGRERQTAGPTYVLARGLAQVAHIVIPQDDGLALNPDVPLKGYSELETVLKDWEDELGVDRDRDVPFVLRRLARTQVTPHYPIGFLLAVIPAPLWEVALRLLLDGPAVAGVRATFAVENYSEETVAPNRRAKKRRRARKPTEDMRAALVRLFTEFVLLRGSHPNHAVLGQWAAVPHVPLPPKQPKGGYIVQAPDLRDVRRRLREINVEIAARLEIPEGGDELGAMARMGDSALRSAALFHLLRDRCLVVKLAGRGCRPDAVSRTNRSDIYRCRPFVEEHFAGRAAIAIRPEKHEDDAVERFKVLTEEELRWFDAYIYYVDRLIAYFYTADLSGRQNRPPLKKLPSHHALFITDMVTCERLSEDAISRICSGALPSGVPGTDGYNAGRKPLIVRTAGVNPDLPQALRQYLGWTASEYRHLASQLAERGGELWNRKHPGAPGSPTPEPHLYSTALLDQKPEGPKLRTIYGDRDEESAYERFAARAGEMVFRLLTGDEGAVKRPNTERLGTVLRELADVEQRLTEREAHLDGLIKPRLTLVKPAAETPAVTGDRLDLIIAQNELLLAKQSALEAQLGEFRRGFCQRPSVSPQGRPSVLPNGGHVFSPLVAIGSPQHRVSRAVVAEP